MSEREMRRILDEVIDDLDGGRIRRPWPFRMVRGIVMPAVLAGGLGLAAAAGCSPLSPQSDSGAAADVDSGFASEYMAPPTDAGNVEVYGTELYSNPDIDSSVAPPYMAPPWDSGIDAGDVQDYAAPPAVDAGGEDFDALYSAPGPGG